MAGRKARRGGGRASRKYGASPAFPDATNTGPDAAGYTSRTTYSGPTTISTNGTVVSGKNIDSDIVIGANNVTIQGCAIVGRVLINNSAANVQILDCSVRNATFGSGHDMLIWGQSENQLDIRRCDIKWAMSDPVKLGVGPYKIHDNWIHDNSQAADGVHADLIETFGGTCAGLEIVHNTIIYPYTAENTTTCIMLSPDTATWYQDILVDNNLLGGCTVVMYPPGAGPSSPTQATNCRVINNHITTQGGLYPNGGASGVSYHSPNVVMDWTTGGNEWSGNVWHDGPNAGLPVLSSD